MFKISSLTLLLLRSSGVDGDCGMPFSTIPDPELLLTVLGVAFRNEFDSDEGVTGESVPRNDSNDESDRCVDLYSTRPSKTDFILSQTSFSQDTYARNMTRSV